jgi:hypothetical protein
MKEFFWKTLLRVWLRARYVGEWIARLRERRKPSDNKNLYELFRDVSHPI